MQTRLAATRKQVIHLACLQVLCHHDTAL